MSAVNFRKRKPHQTVQNSSIKSPELLSTGEQRGNSHQEAPDSRNISKLRHSSAARKWRRVSGACGIVVCMFSGCFYSWYLSTLHENRNGFGKITPLRREMSFRLESGLYYSYYKHVIDAPSMAQGLYGLLHDRSTAHPSTINILRNFTIYPELVIGALYRTFSHLKYPVDAAVFYVSCVFALQATLIWSIYLITWSLSKSWLAAFLSVLFVAVNRDDTTRADSSVPSRESFALPFLWIQVAILNVYLKSSTDANKRVHLIGLVCSTFTLALTWQSAQVIVLLQAIAIFAVAIWDFIPLRKVYALFLVQIISLVCVFFCQCCHVMVLKSLVFSFVPAAIIVFKIKSRMRQCVSPWTQTTTFVCFVTALYFLSAIFLTLCINFILKILLRQDGDDHTLNFILAKAGYADPGELDVWLSLCSETFRPLDYAVYERMSLRFVLPLNVLFTIGTISSVIIGKLRQIRKNTKCARRTKTNGAHSENRKTITEKFVCPLLDGAELAHRPELVFHTAQQVLFGLLAVSAAGYKYLWSPYVCMMASLAVSDARFWNWLIGKCLDIKGRTLRTARHISTLTVILVVFAVNAEIFQYELRMTSEFDDPHLRHLVSWVSRSTDQNATFTGIMGTMATVKLCTGRPIINHPNYGDKELHMRTKQMYQVYGRVPPEQVHKTMRNYDVTYVVIEERICSEQPEMTCMIPYLMDVTNGHVGGSGVWRRSSGLVVAARVPRFCTAVSSGRGKYARLFKEVFINDAYRVYQVKK